MNATYSILALVMPLLITPALLGQGTPPPAALPDSVYGFSLLETSAPGGTAGTAYRYKGAKQTWADVFVYAVPEDRLNTSDSAQMSAEVEDYVTGLALGVDRGRYDAYEVSLNKVISVETPRGSVTGRVVVMVYRRDNQSFVSFMHLFVREQSYVKVRLTLPASEWSDSMAPNFALELAKVLFS